MNALVIKKIAERAANQAGWLANNAPEVMSEQKHLDEGSPERAYWHYGYMVALRDVLKSLDTKISN